MEVTVTLAEGVLGGWVENEEMDITLKKLGCEEEGKSRASR